MSATANMTTKSLFPKVGPPCEDHPVYLLCPPPFKDGLKSIKNISMSLSVNIHSILTTQNHKPWNINPKP